MTEQLGKPILRKEDPALLSGRGRYADDLPIPVGTLHAHVDPLAACACRDRRASMPARRWRRTASGRVITGEDVRKLSDPFMAAVKTPVQQWTLAVERVRYVGEPVALVVAESRYLAEDAAELVTIDYAAARCGDRSARRVQEFGAASASASQDQRNLGARILATAIRTARSRGPIGASP